MLAINRLHHVLPASQSVFKNMKTALRILVSTTLVLTTVSCSKRNANYELLASKNIQCPAGSELRYEPWGESGLEAICLMRQGPVVIAEYGHIQIEGQNDRGKQVGEWRWLDASGKVIRTERYGGTKP